VRLPVAVAEAVVDATPELGERRSLASKIARTVPVRQLHDLRIVVVSDSPDGRALTSLMLTDAGASVVAVGSVREALQAIDAQRPDVLVSDIRLPDEDGYALIRQVRDGEAEQGGFLVALAVTGYVRAEDQARILAAGFQAHVPKPVEPGELVTAIATQIDRLRNGDSGGPP
jgi:CheY-like chemotaxis protein